MRIYDRLKSVETELEKHIRAADVVKGNIQALKEQIEVFSKKGQELASHCTFLNGQIHMLKELEKEAEDESL